MVNVLGILGQPRDLAVRAVLLLSDGMLLSLILGFTLGSIGEEGRSFVDDIRQVNSRNFWSAFTGGVIFNASNILLSASISLAGMSVAFPVGVGLALVLGVFINYFGAPKGDPVILFLGVFLVVTAIILNGIASGKMSKGTEEQQTRKKGIIIAIIAGFLMSFFYRFVAAQWTDKPGKPNGGHAYPLRRIFYFRHGHIDQQLRF